MLFRVATFNLGRFFSRFFRTKFRVFTSINMTQLLDFTCCNSCCEQTPFDVSKFLLPSSKQNKEESHQQLSNVKLSVWELRYGRQVIRRKRKAKVDQEIFAVYST